MCLPSNDGGHQRRPLSSCFTYFPHLPPPFKAHDEETGQARHSFRLQTLTGIVVGLDTFFCYRYDRVALFTQPNRVSFCVRECGVDCCSFCSRPLCACSLHDPYECWRSGVTLLGSSRTLDMLGIIGKSTHTQVLQCKGNGLNRTPDTVRREGRKIATTGGSIIHKRPDTGPIACQRVS